MLMDTHKPMWFMIDLLLLYLSSLTSCILHAFLTCSFSSADGEKQWVLPELRKLQNFSAYLYFTNCTRTISQKIPYGHDLIRWSSITIVSFQAHMFSLNVSEQSGWSVMHVLAWASWLTFLYIMTCIHDVSFQCVKLVGIQEQVKRPANLYQIRGMYRYCIYRYTPGNSLPYLTRVSLQI